MSTRSIIGIYTDEHQINWKGRQVHWCGYPSGVGQSLFVNYQQHFRGQLQKMINVLVTNSLTGWEHLDGKDFTRKPVAQFADDEQAPIASDLDPDPEYLDEPDGNWTYRDGHDYGQRWAYILNAGLDSLGNQVNLLTIYALEDTKSFIEHNAELTGLPMTPEEVREYDMKRWHAIALVNLDSEEPYDWYSFEENWNGWRERNVL